MLCCFFLSIRTGCFLGALSFLIFAFVKVILCILFPLEEEPQTVIILNIVLIFIAGTMLFIGTLMEDRICIITFLCFVICAIVVQGVGLLALYVTTDYKKIPAPVLVVLVGEHVPQLYMIPIAILEFRIVKEKHMRIAENYDRSGNVSNVMMTSHTSGLVPGLNF